MATMPLIKSVVGVLLLVLLATVEATTPPGIANNPSHARCLIKKYKMCYNLEHVCPKFCPDSCTVECVSCKPICGPGSDPPPDTDTPSPPDNGSGGDEKSPPPSDGGDGGKEKSPPPSDGGDDGKDGKGKSPPPSDGGDGGKDGGSDGKGKSPPPSDGGEGGKDRGSDGKGKSPPPSDGGEGGKDDGSDGKGKSPPPSDGGKDDGSDGKGKSPPPSDGDKDDGSDGKGKSPPPSDDDKDDGSDGKGKSPPPSGGDDGGKGKSPPPESSPPPKVESPPPSSPPATPTPTPSPPTSPPQEYSPPPPTTPSPSPPPTPTTPKPSPPLPTPSSPSPSSPPSPSPTQPPLLGAPPPEARAPEASRHPKDTPPPPLPPTVPVTPSPSSPTPSPPVSTPPTSPTPPPHAPYSPPQSPGDSSEGGAVRRQRCRNRNYPQCYGVQHVCPSSCPNTCEVDCVTCKPVCKCDMPGAVCQDPRFIGGDGITFYFHGKKDKDFCLVTEPNFQINAHFIGRRNENMKRDFTWVQSIGILFGDHQLFVGARKTANWDDAVDHIALAFDGEPILLSAAEGSMWQPTDLPTTTITRDIDTNSVIVEVKGLFQISAKVVPITKHESRIHNYGITDDDCFAHLELGFKFYSLSGNVNGVLGQTYSDNYVSRAKLGVAMPVLGGEKEFAVSNIFARDCSVSQFLAGKMSPENHLASVLELPSMKCGSGIDGRGVVCKK